MKNFVPLYFKRGVAVTAVAFPVFMGLLWLRWSGDGTWLEDALILSSVWSVAAGACAYCGMTAYRQFTDYLRRECFTEWAGPALAQKPYVFRVRGMWMKVLLTMGKLFIFCGVISFILYSCDSRIVKSSVPFIIFWLVLAAGSGAAYLIVRRAFRDMDAGE